MESEFWRALYYFDGMNCVKSRGFKCYRRCVRRNININACFIACCGRTQKTVSRKNKSHRSKSQILIAANRCKLCLALIEPFYQLPKLDSLHNSEKGRESGYGNRSIFCRKSDFCSHAVTH